MSNNNFRFLNEKCPVCNNNFKDDDDIVVCPHCGTPHHRDCYKENTMCANQQKHDEGFRWEPTFVTPEETKNTAEEIKHPFGQAIDLEQMPLNIPIPTLQQNLLDSFPQELEDGVKTEDVAIFVRHESPKYLKKFQQIKDGKLTWNWAAFFFAPYWFFYRKMHKLGVVFLAIFILLSSLSFLPPAIKLSETIYDFEAQVTELAENAESDKAYESALMDVYKSTFATINENKTGLIIYMGQSVANFVISVFIGLNANKWYYKHTISQVRKICSESEKQKVKEMLFIKGGVAYGAPLLAILFEKTVFFALEMLISTFM